MPVCSPKSPDLGVQRGDQAVVVEHRGAQLTGERQQLLHRLAGQSLGLDQLALQLRRRLLDRRLEPQRDRGQRLVDLVVEVLGDPPPLALLGLDRGPPGLPALGLEPRDHPPERAVEALDLGAVARGAPTSPLLGIGEVDLLHRRDQLVERLEAAAEQQPVTEQRGDRPRAPARSPRDRA